MFFKKFFFKKKRIYQSLFVSINNDFIEIVVYFEGPGGITFEVPDTERMYLPVDITSYELGCKVREMLSRSRRLSTKEGAFYYSNFKIYDTWKEREKTAMKQYKYKTKRAMFSGMRCCIVIYDTNEDSVNFNIYPFHQEKMKNFIYKSDDYDIKIPYNCTNEELGQAIREGLRRATTEI